MTNENLPSNYSIQISELHPHPIFANAPKSSSHMLAALMAYSALPSETDLITKYNISESSQKSELKKLFEMINDRKQTLIYKLKSDKLEVKELGITEKDGK